MMNRTMAGDRRTAANIVVDNDDRERGIIYYVIVSYRSCQFMTTSFSPKTSASGGGLYDKVLLVGNGTNHTYTVHFAL